MSNIIKSEKREQMLKWELQNELILVKIKDGRGTSASGLEMVVTDNNPLVPDRGQVVNVASTCEKVKIDQKVLIELYQGQKFVDEGGDTYIMLKEKYVLVILPDDADITIRQGQLR